MKTGRVREQEEEVIMEKRSRSSRGNKRGVRGEETRKQRRAEKVYFLCGCTAAAQPIWQRQSGSHGDGSHMFRAGSEEQRDFLLACKYAAAVSN